MHSKVRSIIDARHIFKSSYDETSTLKILFIWLQFCMVVYSLSRYFMLAKGCNIFALVLASPAHPHSPSAIRWRRGRKLAVRRGGEDLCQWSTARRGGPSRLRLKRSGSSTSARTTRLGGGLVKVLQIQYRRAIKLLFTSSFKLWV